MPAAKTATAKPTTEAIPYSVEQIRTWYRQMLLMRRFEEKAGQMYGQQKIKGFCHLYIGQEAVGAGVESAMRPDDYLITAYRDHGNALVRGISSRAVMAELYGKATGCSKGKGGSMHMFSAEHNFLGGHGLVGAQIPMGAGVAFACQYEGTDKVCITMFGDGAARQGALHEVFNMAMMWKLPAVFICENNFYAMGTAVERSSNVPEIYKLGLAYEMPAERVNGMNVFEVHEAVSRAVSRARKGDGPTFLEILTYRYKGHSMSDPAKYRTKEELEEYRERDPLVHLKHFAINNGLLTEADFEAFEEDVKAEVMDAVDFSEKSPWPDAAELYTDVYVGDYPFIMD
jgi:pyruvate dehydrogenase E1 component alpha subunit